MNGLWASEIREMGKIRALALVDLPAAKTRASAWVKKAPSRKVRRLGALRCIKGIYAQLPLHPVDI